MAIIGIDLDGTLAESLEEKFTAKQKEYFRNLYSQIREKEPKKIQGIIMTTILKIYFNIKWKNWQNIKMTEEHLPKIIYEIGGRKMLFPKINIVTSSYGKREFIERWLNKNSIIFSNLIFTEPLNKYKYADILIDDRPDIILNAIKHGKIGILYSDEDFNAENLLTDEEKERFYVTDSWGKIKEIIFSLKSKLTY
jgi:DNA-directed RNA polymerase beta' subunit